MLFLFSLVFRSERNHKGHDLGSNWSFQSRTQDESSDLTGRDFSAAGKSIAHTLSNQSPRLTLFDISPPRQLGLSVLVIPEQRNLLQSRCIGILTDMVGSQNSKQLFAIVPRLDQSESENMLLIILIRAPIAKPSEIEIPQNFNGATYSAHTATSKDSSLKCNVPNCSREKPFGNKSDLESSSPFGKVKKSWLTDIGDTSRGITDPLPVACSSVR